MSPSLKTLDLERLSLDERLQLMEVLWNSIASAVDEMEIPESHKVELERRIAAHEADSTAGSSWEEVKQRLRQRKLGESM